MKPIVTKLIQKSILGIAAIIFLNLSISGNSFAQERTELMAELAACRSVADNTARLACFDQTASRMLLAHERGDLTVVDRAQIQQARRQLFGFSGAALPSIFGGGSESEEVTSIQTVLNRASRDAHGQWTFYLADDSEWKQIDNESPRLRVQTGVPVRVRRAAFGSYFLNVGDARAIRVRRQ